MCKIPVPHLEDRSRFAILLYLNKKNLIIIPMTIASIASIALSILFTLMTLLFIFRIVLTWYPQVELGKFPFSLIAIPTEPFLAPTRKIIQPLGGVDVTPVIWVGIFTLIREVLLGQQGLITMALRLS
jgi:YggT family protein